jgi:hypothetical protein
VRRRVSLKIEEEQRRFLNNEEEKEERLQIRRRNVFKLGRMRSSEIERRIWFRKR